MDLWLFQLINQFANRYWWLDTAGVFLADYLGYVLVLVLFLFLIKDSRKYWPMVVQVAGAAVLSRLVIANVIRLLWRQPRPFVEHDVNLLLSPSSSSSFPSGHASLYFALAAVVYLHHRRAGIAFLAASFVMGLARVFSGVHWPSDIASGALVGILSGWASVTAYRKLFSGRGRGPHNTRQTTM